MSQLSTLSPTELYIRELVHPEDDLLRAVQQAIRDDNKPTMSIGPEQGRALQVLMAACGAANVLEIGTFYGYSALWIARALPAGGRLTCLEVSRVHADKAAGFLQAGGVADRVEIRVGPAGKLLPGLADRQPFDLIFLDADKESYADYLPWLERWLRPGGLLVVDNVYVHGRLADPDSDAPTATGNAGHPRSPGS